MQRKQPNQSIQSTPPCTPPLADSSLPLWLCLWWY